MNKDVDINLINRRSLRFVLGVLLIDVLTIGMVIPVLPELIQELLVDSKDAGNSQSAIVGMYVGLIGSAYALTQFLFAPVIGAISDTIGRRPVLLASIFGLGVDYLIQGFAPSITWLFVGRVIAGLFGASITTSNAYIADISTEENRARNFGLVGAMFGIGFTIAPVFGGLLGSVHLRLPFFVAAGLALVNWLYGWCFLAESHPSANRNKFELKSVNPLLALSYFNNYPLLPGIAVALFFSSLAQRGLESVWVLYTHYRYVWNEIENGMALGLVGFMAIIVQGFLAGAFIRRVGSRKVAILSSAVLALAFLGYGLAPHGWMIPLIIIFGSLAGLGGPALQCIVGEVVPSKDQGKVQGAVTSLISLTSCFAPFLFSSLIFGYFTSERVAINMPGAPLLVGSILLCLTTVILWRTLR